MEKRFTFVCWNCSKKYSLLCDLDKEKRIVVTCPYCAKESTVDLAAYGKQESTEFNGGYGAPARLAGDSSTDAPLPHVSKKKSKGK